MFVFLVYVDDANISFIVGRFLGCLGYGMTTPLHPNMCFCLIVCVTWLTWIDNYYNRASYYGVLFQRVREWL